MNIEALRFFDRYCKLYEVVANHHLTGQSNNLVLGKGTFCCRFCGKGKPDVTFKSKAHALPEFTGNRTLFSHWECDSCNAKFGRLLESHFAAFMHLNHTLYGVGGKNGFPKFKSSDGISIETTGAFIDWQGVPDEKINLDPANKQVQITQKMPTFIPIAVFKTLIKMAMTVMPESELGYFKDTLEWLGEDAHIQSRFILPNLWMLYGTFESTDRWDQLSIVVVKKKCDTDPALPYMLVNLNYGNFDFQLPIPLCSQDDGSMFDHSAITYLPHLTDFKHGFGKMQLLAFNMYCQEPIVGKEMTFILTDLDGSGTITKMEV